MTYVIQIQNPDDLRKLLLTAAKYSVNTLKSQHKLKALRAEKAEKLTELLNLVNSLDKGFAGLYKALPEHSPETMPPAAKRAQEVAKHVKTPKETALPKKKAKGVVKKVVNAPVVVESPVDVLSSLEQKLDLIESKLNKL